MTSVKEHKYIGKPVEKADALERVTGKAQYGADIYLTGMLHGKVLRSPHPHAKINKIDYSKALELEGVKAIITHKDIPLPKSGKRSKALQDQAKLTLADDKVLFDGHSIAAVAATGTDIAELALDLIEVEYEILSPVTDVVDAMREDAVLVDEEMITATLGDRPTKPSNVAMYNEHGRGDLEAAWAESDAIVERTDETLMVHQGYLEPQACAAQVDLDGTVHVWTTTQGSFMTQRKSAGLLGLPEDKLVVTPMEIGGGFGGKESSFLDCMAIMLSQRTGRPVKMVMDRSEVFRATGPGSPARFTVKVGAKKDGKITGAYIRMAYDAGCTPGSPMAQGHLVSFGPYKLENLRVEAFDVLTNKPHIGSYRAPGGTQVCFAVETAMDMLAEKIGMDPLKFRQFNSVEEGDLMTNNQAYNSIGLKEMLSEIEKHPSWTSKLEEGPNRGRGLAVGFWLGGSGTSSSVVLVHADGTVTVSTGQVDLTGTRTTMMQMAAEELQVPIEDVTVRVVDTGAAPYTDGSWGSRSTWTQSIAIKEACDDVIAQMKAQAAEALQVEPGDIEYADRAFWKKSDPEQAMSWAEVAQDSIHRTGGAITGKGATTRSMEAPAFGANVVDLEVDPGTGKIKILKFTCFQDVGCAINPQQVEGQIQGGAVQGIGWAITEYYHYDKGVLRNPSLLDYRILTALDLPMLDTVITEKPASVGPYGARGVGEICIVPPPPAIANAIHRAVGVRMHDLPMTPEAVFWAIKEKEGNGKKD
jgi:CO/xanthine dehydrogenase Mo-binding subunit